MSGEYYGAEKPAPKFYNNDYEATSPHPKNEKIETPGSQEKRLNGLNDIEEQLEMAEDRCNTLKGQLDYMKQIYGTKKKCRKVSSAHPSNITKSDEDTFTFSTSSVSVVSTEHKSTSLPKRQNSTAIGTDNTGAAVRTINNILTGITDSVNRLSELHVQVADSPRTRTALKLSRNKTSISEGTSQVPIQPLIKENELEPDNTCLNSTSNYSNVIKSRSVKKKHKEAKGTIKKQLSTQMSRKSIKVDRRINSAIYPPTTNASRKILTSTRSAATTIKSLSTTKNPKLVELFHNNDAKDSDSDECQRSKQSHADGDHRQNAESVKVPLLELSNGTYQEIVASQNNTRRLCQNVLANEYYYSQAVNRPDNFQKSYELPTIASRMKQVAKTYLGTFSFKAMVCKLVGGKINAEKMPMMPKKTIPFCAAISTSPSHNIGINIQQVMNILKNRQPVNGISPTLAHNIGLAAERLHSKPLSTLVSSINSNTCYVKPQQCPLSKCKLNYQYLQDLAKSIPEETVEEVESEDQPEIKTIIITGPSGDMEVKSRNIPQWTVDRSDDNVCTCISNAGPDLSYVCNKVQKKSGNLISSQISMSQKTKHLSTKWNPKKEKRPHTTQPTYKPSTENPFEGKEKSLKLVLTHLHDEFEKLNKRYEDLSQKSAEGENVEIMKELEVLEAELTKKEEEITMVMSLCKEVMALKQQIKCLKQNTSHCGFAQERKESTTSNFSNFNNPKAAFHLTKLLKQIQTYQMKYKNGVEV